VISRDKRIKSKPAEIAAFEPLSSCVEIPSGSLIDQAA
jgi:hypothetical protein